MTNLDLLMLRKLHERLTEEMRTRGEFLLGGSAQSYEDYKHTVGYLKGMSDALIWAKEINDELIGRDKNAR